MAHGVELTNGKGESEQIDLAATRVVPAGEVGSAYGGSDRIFTTFDDGRYFETRDARTEIDFEEMIRQDGKAKTLEQVLTLPLMAAPHTIDPAEGDKGEVELCREALTRPANAGGMSTPLDMVIAQMTSAVLVRRAYFEKVFRVDGERVTFDKIAFRPARTCSLLRSKTDYAFQGFKQRFMRDNNYVTVTIPPQKALVYIHGQHRDPLNGISDLDTARSIYETKQKVRFLWGTFLENQTIPKAVAHSRSNDPGVQEEMAKKVATIKGGGVVAVGPDEDVTAFESSGSGAAVFRSAMDYLSVEMAGSVLAGFTELGAAAAAGRGSFALSKDQSDFFLQSRVAVLKEMAATFTGFCLADLCLWNFGVDAAVPTFTFKPPAQEAVESAITLLQALATSPQSTNLPTEFVDLLTEKVAGYLGISVDVVHRAITERQAAAPNTPAAQLQSGVQAAHQLVASSGLPIGSQPSPSPATAATPVAG